MPNVDSLQGGTNRVQSQNKHLIPEIASCGVNERTTMASRTEVTIPDKITIKDLYVMIHSLTTTARETKDLLAANQQEVAKITTTTEDIEKRLQVVEHNTMSAEQIQEVRAQADMVTKVSESITATMVATQSSITNCDDNVSIALEAIKKSNEKVAELNNIVSLQNVKIAEMQGQITDLQTRSMKRNVIIHGIIRSKDEKCVRKASKFF